MAIPAAVLNIVVTASTGQANASLGALQTQLRATSTAAEAEASRATKAINKGATVGALGLAGLGAASIKAAVDYQSSFAEVRKTVNTNKAGFDKISDGIRNMAKTIPVGTDELNNIAGAAGALGIKANNIVRFTKIAAELGTTTNLTSDAAATSLARLANVMETKGKKSFERMGSTLVALGNKGSSTEDEIAALSLRLAGAGQTVGLTEKAVYGLSASMANVGISAEAGGTAMSQVMLNMQGAIAKGGSELKSFAETAQMSVGSFKQTFAADPTKAIQAYVMGLDKVKDAGGDVQGTLDGVHMNTVRVRDMLLRLGGATNQITKDQGIANKAWEKNNALTKEAETRYNTAASQFVILKNRLKDVAISIGLQLLPTVTKLVGVFSDFAAGPAFKYVVAGLAAVAAAFVGLKIALGTMKLIDDTRLAMERLGNTTTVLRVRLLALAAAEKVKAAFVALGNTTVVLRARLLAMAAIGKITAAFTAVKAAVTSLAFTARGAMMATGIGALIVGATLIVMHWDKVKKFLMPLWEWMQQAGKDVWAAIGPTMTKVGQWFAEAGKNIAAFAKDAAHWIAGAWQVIQPILLKIGELLVKAFIFQLKAVVAYVKFGFNFIVRAVTDVVNAIITAWNFLKPAIVPVVKAVFAAVKWYVVTYIKAVIAYVKTGIKVIGAAWKVLKAVLVPVVKAVWAIIKGLFKVGVAYVKTAIKVGVTQVKAAWWVIKNVLIDPIKTAFNVIKGIVQGVWKGPVGEAIRTIAEKLGGAFSGVADKVKSVFEDVKTAISDAVGTIKTIVLWLISEVINRIPGVEIDVSGLQEESAPQGYTGSHGYQNGQTHNNVGKGGGKFGGLARGGHVTQPGVLVGEEAPRHPEVVIATNPAYRNRNLQLWMQTGKALGVPGFSLGGFASDAFGTVTGGVSDAAGAAWGGAKAVASAPGKAIGKAKELIENLINGVNERMGAVPDWASGLGGYIKDQGIAYIKSKVPGLAKGGVAGGGALPALGGVKMSKGAKKGLRGAESGAEAALAGARGEQAGVVEHLSEAEMKRTRETGTRVKAIKSEQTATQALTAVAVKGDGSRSAAARKLASAGGTLTKAQRQLGNASSKTTTEIGTRLVKALKSGRDNATTFGRRVAGATGDLKQDAASDMKGVRDSVVNNLAQASSRGMKSAKSMASGIGSNFNGLSSTVASALGKIGADTNSILGSLGAKKIAFSLSSGSSGSEPAKKMAEGGFLVPGIGSGDKVPLHLGGKLAAMVEPKELVTVGTRRTAAAVLGINSELGRYGPEKVPALAKGGLVNGDGKKPPISGGLSAALALMNKYEAASYPYLWGGGHGGFVNGASPVDCSGFVSDVLHAAGLLDGAPMVSGALMNWGSPAKGTEPLVVYANPEHTLMSVNGRFAGTSGSNPGGGAGWISTPDSGYLSGFAKRTMDVGKGISQEVKKIMLKGPEGTLKTIGQSAIDMARGAANKKVAAMAPMGAFGGGDPGDPISGLPKGLMGYNRLYKENPPGDWSGYQMPVPAVEALAEWVGTPGVTMGQIAHGESNYRPGAVGSDAAAGYGNTFGYGLWMITSGVGNEPLVQKYGGFKEMLNPVKNAMVMGDMYAAAGGIKPWYGTRFLTDQNAHYNGNLLKMAEGGLLSKGSVAPMPLSLPAPKPPVSSGALGEAAGANTGGGKNGGGWPDIQKVVDLVFKAKDTKKQTAEALRKTLATNLGAKYDKLKTRGLAVGADGELGGRLAKLQTLAESYGDYADKAANAADFGGLYRAGSEADLEGLTNGSETFWVTKQLTTWHKFRESLVILEREVQEREKMAKKVARAVNDKLRKWEGKLADAQKVLDVEGKLPKDWKKDYLDPTQASLKEWNDQKDKKRIELGKKFESQGGRLQGTRKFLEDYSMVDVESMPKLFPDTKPLQAVQSLLAGTVLPKVNSVASTMASYQTTIDSAFNDVQGSGRSHKAIQKLPDISDRGALGGYIYDAQERLRTLSTATGTGESQEAIASILAEQLAQSRRDNALLRSQMGVFGSAVPYMGAFAKGGVALVGEKGPELAAMPHGTRISTAADTKSMMEPEVKLVFNDCEINTNGQRLEEAVQVEVNGQLRTVAATVKGRKPSKV